MQVMQQTQKLMSSYSANENEYQLWISEDLSKCNRAHCEYLIALGSYGLCDKERAKKCYDAVLAIDQSHQGAILHKKLL